MRLLWVKGLVESTGHRTWTTDKLFNPRVVTVSSAQADQFSLYLSNSTHSVHYFAHEADRFASASFESLLSSTKSDDFPRSTGWLLIRSYYAAFFAVHALFRVHGWACTRLTQANLKSVNEESQSLFGAAKYAAGLFLVKSASNGRELTCRPITLAQGGTHEALWSLLRAFFDEAVHIVLTAPDTDGQSFSTIIEDFFKLVDPYGGPSWFSTIRNRLNYGHEYGAWFPYVKSTSDYDRISAALGPWRKSPDEAIVNRSNDELISFSTACAFLVSLCRETVRDLTYRSRTNSPFRQASGLLVQAADV
jgi:hypothetical protein